MNTSQAQAVDWDAIIVGAGPAGSAAAITLARSGARVLLLEKRNNLGTSLGESLPPAAIGMVEHFLGPLDKVLESGGLSKTSGNVSCWDSSQPDVSDFFYTSKGHGLCVDRQYFDEALRQQAIESGAKLHQGVAITGCQRLGNERWKLSAISDGSKCEYTARFLLDCTGRRSAIANMIGIERQYDDSLFAYAVRFVAPTLDDQDLSTRIEACQDGWWYSNRLPIKNQPHKDKRQTHRLLVFHTDKDSNAAKQASSVDGILSLLEQSSPHLNDYLRRYGYKAVGRIRGAAAGTERLSQFCGDGWLAVGDAAQAYDPLSSQGIYKALSSGSLAGQMVQYSLKNSDTSTGKQADFFIKRYAQEQNKLWQRYVQQRNHYYATEQRWPSQTFWRRRQQSTTHSMSNC
jgi:flavin-dependent dehydrogenase